MYSSIDVTKLVQKSKGCPLCKGTGRIVLHKKNRVVYRRCECRTELDAQLALLAANIPKRYWGLHFDLKHAPAEFRRDNKKQLSALKKYADRLPQALSKGLGLFLCGSSGVGRTFFGCWILMKALKMGHSVHFFRLSELVELAFEALKDEEQKFELDLLATSIDFLMIDDVDKRIPTTTASYLAERFFRQRHYAGKPLIVTSGIVLERLSHVLDKSICEVLEESLVQIVLVGKSFRPAVRRDAIKQVLS